MSTTTKYTDLFDDVLPEVPGCGDALAENAIRNAVIAFCSRSWIWKHYPDNQDVAAGTDEYTLEPPAGADVAAVTLLRLDGRELDPLPAEAVAVVNTLPTGAVDDCAPCVPPGFYMPDPMTVKIVPVPECSVTAGLQFVLAVQPRRASTSFPSWIWVKYQDALAAGAKARLMLMPGKPWSNAQLGADNRNTFMGEAANARVVAVQNFSRSPLRTRTQH